MIKNACATQAILSVLLNVDHQDVTLGPVLSELKQFAAAFTPAVSDRANVCTVANKYDCNGIILYSTW